ncbi:MAG: type II toxin-antitoxin system Phd/YefM family antitoxin [Clostridia bacterium]|nr:type II toxin-antitoxin system Phd/YefM family antitoxin [Deltaproteobacteria bacterium]
MPRSRREIAAGRFKAECLALLDRVERTREVIVVTKRGRPVAKVVPLDSPSKKTLRGSLVFSGDILLPLDDAWDVER